MNKYIEIANALAARQTEIVQAYAADPKLQTEEARQQIIIYQIGLLTEALTVTLKELGTKRD